MRRYIKHSRQCFIRYPNTSNSVKNTPLRVIFSILFSVFGYPDEKLSLVFDSYYNYKYYWGRNIQLHWLPLEQRITFKIAVITFKALHGAAPSYIPDLIKPYTPGRLLRSSNQFLLSTSKFNLETYGDKQSWLALHTYVSSLPRDSSETFRLTRQTSRLKSR